jgi:hypothetical protein
MGLPVAMNSAGAKDSRLTEKEIRDAVLLRLHRPEWIYKEDFEQIANLGLFAVGRCVFESGLSHELAAKYETNSWVKNVESVHLRYPARVDLELEWRKPAAIVPQAGMVLDQDGYSLNLMCAAAKNLPRLANVPCQHTPPGQQVAEKDLLSALELLRTAQDALLLGPGNAKNLKPVEVLREASGQWRINTENGPVIEWGVFSDDPPLDEPRTHEKSESLRRCLCDCKDSAALEYIKLYTATPVFKDRVVRKEAAAKTPKH